MNNREKLIDMMYAHSLERLDIAELVLADRQVIDGWLAPPESARHEEVPDMAIELLQLKLGAIDIDANDEQSPAPSGD